MDYDSAERSVFAEEDIARILLELAAVATDHTSLRSWAADPGVQLDRVVAMEALTYVRLAVRDEHGEPIVLMLLDGTWERIL
ncbi:hypothetical protein [Agrococcus jenensis]|uniref:Uncharacterized protein n=1 Tax=Agrococcus jenensis TaxID=46353 RepID=A0A3N2AQ28_9MICO|nr:hypothetical protein [Agrococcus jenensis]ROR64812.1 hypothetical protein EDD26_0161 [Agrococcus jenensis]